MVSGGGPGTRFRHFEYWIKSRSRDCASSHCADYHYAQLAVDLLFDQRSGPGLGSVWWLFYNPPAEESFITPEELEHIQQSLASARLADEAAAKDRLSWIDLFKYRQLWVLLAAKFLTDAVWFFFIFWLPKYLGDVRHLNIKQIGYYAWIPYALAGAGSFTGGWLSSMLVRRHLTVNLSRKICLGLSAAMMPISLLIAKSPLGWALVIFSMALFAHQFWSTILQTLAADIFPSAVVGSVAGLMGEWAPSEPCSST